MADYETLIEEAREWLIDIFPEDEEEIEEADAKTIQSRVTDLYDGGWLSFVKANK